MIETSDFRGILKLARTEISTPDVVYTMTTADSYDLFPFLNLLATPEIIFNRLPNELFYILSSALNYSSN